MEYKFDGLYNSFLELEDSLDLFSLRINGVPIWERIRFETFREILYQKDLWSLAHSEVEKDVGNISKGIWLWLKNIFSRNPYMASQHDYLFWGHERRKQQEDGLWWDIYCDTLHSSLDLDYLHVEIPHDNKHLSPVKTGNLRYLDLIEYSSTIQRELGLVDPTFTGRQTDKIHTISTRIEQEFAVDMDIMERVRFRLSLRKSLKPLYERFLNRVDPKVVFIVPSLLRHTFIEVCKDQGRPVVELQHGVLTDYEYGYPGERTKQTFPDYFFTWGSFWNNKVELPLPNDNVRSVGYPYFERQREKYQNSAATEQILFISQGNIGEDLSKVAVELSQHPKIEATNITYKLHPGEYDRWKQAYPWLRDTDFAVVGDAGPDLYELLAGSTAQVGVYSTALFEGLGFGLDTYLMDFPGVELLSELYTNGHAKVLSTSQELASELTRTDSTSVNPSMFFKPDPIDNFSEELAKLQK